jgi:hypothetical protein
MSEDEILGYFAKVGVEVPAYCNPFKKERAEIWSDPVKISEETHKKILKILKEEVKKNV